LTISLTSLAESIEQSSLGTAIAESRYLWPALEGLHLLSLALSFGLILLTDLRLAGLVLREVPFKEVVQQLRPWVLTGFALTFVSGALIFCSEATTVMASPLWTIKCILIVVGGINALYFERVTSQHHTSHVDTRTPPPSVRYAGLASIVIWTATIVCGRLLAYLPK
jgi:hypothetical protein